jgi:Flp pilus assembly protein CpaB
LAVISAMGGYIVLGWLRGTIEIYVATRDLPAFHQITQADVRKERVPQDNVPLDALRDRDGLLGRYMLKPLAQDRPFRKSVVGPLLKPDELHGLSFVAIEASPESTLGGRLARGDRVDVLLSATDADSPSVGLRDVLVVEVAREAVVIAVTPADSKALLKARGTSKVALVRVRAYTRP